MRPNEAHEIAYGEPGDAEDLTRPRTWTDSYGYEFSISNDSNRALFIGGIVADQATGLGILATLQAHVAALGWIPEGAQEHAALREEVKRLRKEGEDASKWACPTCADRIAEWNRQETEIQRLGGIAAESINREREGLAKLDEFLKYVREVEGQRDAIKEKANKVYRLGQDWLADDDKAVEFYNSIICLGHVLGPNVAPTTGEQEAAALRAQLAQVRATVEEWKVFCEIGVARHPTLIESDEHQAGRLEAYTEVLALLPEEGGK